jgi:dUTP pyrophosphatase
MQSTIKVKLEVLPHGAGLPFPRYQTEGSAGMDLSSAEDVMVARGATKVVATGIRMVVPEGYEIQIRSRGGLASKGIFVTNGPGTVDSDYRGEIMVLLTNLGLEDFYIKRGDRVAQAVTAPVLRAEIDEVDFIDTEETERGEGRFSSTGVA